MPLVHPPSGFVLFRFAARVARGGVSQALGIEIAFVTSNDCLETACVYLLATSRY